MTAQLTLSNYTAAAQRTDLKRETDPGLSFPLLGLFGETGSLLSEVKKKQRDPVAYLGYEDSVLEELGDVLWYLVAVASRARLSLYDLAINLDCDGTTWSPHGGDDLTFSAIELNSGITAGGPSEAFEKSSLLLAAEVGLLLTDYRAGRLERNRSALKGRLIAVLRALREAAHEAGLSLEQAALINMAKIADRWPTARTYPVLFDEKFPKTEQLPRTLVVAFEDGQSRRRR